MVSVFGQPRENAADPGQALPDVARSAPHPVADRGIEGGTKISLKTAPRYPHTRARGPSSAGGGEFRAPPCRGGGGGRGKKPPQKGAHPPQGPGKRALFRPAQCL